jgi:hypothetical protein
MHGMKFLNDHLLIVILFKRLFALFGATRSSCDQFMGLNLDAIATRTYNYDPEGFVRANSGLGTIHCSGT